MSRPNAPSAPRRALAATLVALTLAGIRPLWAAETAPGSPAAAPSAPAPAKKAAPEKEAVPAKPVDINSASRAQLKTLPGIGDEEAARIIAGRPYLSKADLASRKILPLGVYVPLKDRIIAIQKQPPKRKDSERAPGSS